MPYLNMFDYLDCFVVSYSFKGDLKLFGRDVWGIPI